MTSRRILTYQNGLLQLQRQPAPSALSRSRPAAARTILKAPLEKLSQQSLQQQLAEIRNRLNGRRSGLVLAREGMENVKVLDRFTRSLERPRR